MLTLEEIKFLNNVASELHEMNNSEEVIQRLEDMKKEYVEKFA